MKSPALHIKRELLLTQKKTICQVVNAINRSPKIYSMLKLEIIGNLGADAQIRYANGNKFVAMRVCHSQKINNVETSTWVSVAWSGDGGGLLPYLRKGTKIFARGNLQVRVYRSQTGDWQAGLNLSAHEIELAGSRQDAPTEQSQAAGEKPLGEKVNDEDEPF